MILVDPYHRDYRNDVQALLGGDFDDVDAFIEETYVLCRKVRLMTTSGEIRERLEKELRVLRSAENILSRYAIGRIPIYVNNVRSETQAEASADFCFLSEGANSSVTDVIAALELRLKELAQLTDGRSKVNKTELYSAIMQRYTELTGASPIRSDITFENLLVSARRAAGDPKPESLERLKKALFPAPK